MVTGRRPARSRPTLTPAACVAAAFHGLAFAGLMLAGLGLLLVVVASAFLTVLGFGVAVLATGLPGLHRTLLALLIAAVGLGIGRFFVPSVLISLRRLASLTRRLVGEWCGVAIAEPYQPPPPDDGRQLSGPTPPSPSGSSSPNAPWPSTPRPSSSSSTCSRPTTTTAACSPCSPTWRAKQSA